LGDNRNQPSDRAKLLLKKKFCGKHARFIRPLFDVVSMWHVLEHVPDLDLQIKRVKKNIEASGTLIVAVPNFKSYDAKHYAFGQLMMPIHFGISLKMQLKCFCKRRNDARKVLQ
jgi:2-polyprenyl-3-methyl-5-hydroxy-6-metoxy-1,4-benzoquinol methylase